MDVVAVQCAQVITPIEWIREFSSVPVSSVFTTALQENVFLFLVSQNLLSARDLQRAGVIPSLTGRAKKGGMSLLHAHPDDRGVPSISAMRHFVNTNACAKKMVGTRTLKLIERALLEMTDCEVYMSVCEGCFKRTPNGDMVSENECEACNAKRFGTGQLVEEGKFWAIVPVPNE